MFFTQLGVMALSAMMAFSSPQSDAEPYTEEPQPAIVTEAYEYPVTPKDPEWAELGSTQARIKACRIPQEVLESMTEEQLVQAVLDFPFWIELFVYSHVKTGVKSMEKNCDAYAELLRRGTAKEALLTKAAQLQKRPVTTAEEEIENEMIASLILYQEQVEQELTPLEVSQVRGLALSAGGREYELYKAEQEALNSPETPNGTQVSFYKDSICSHLISDYHARMDSSTVEIYHVELVSSGNCKYNCHSYAWHDQSPSNIYWIDDPAPYMSDGSYTKILSGLNASSLTAASGDIIFYGELSDLDHAHSAVMDSEPSGAPLAARTVVSKWGAHGVFRHTLANVPDDYDKMKISVWHADRNKSGWTCRADYPSAGLRREAPQRFCVTVKNKPPAMPVSPQLLQL